MLEAYDFSPIFIVRTCAPGVERKCRDPQRPGSTLKLAQTESPVIHPSYGSGFPTLALVPAETSAPGKL